LSPIYYDVTLHHHLVKLFFQASHSSTGTLCSYNHLLWLLWIHFRQHYKKLMFVLFLMIDNLPYTYKNEGVHIKVTKKKFLISNILINIGDLISIHQRKKSKHCWRWGIELDRVPKETETQKSKAYKKGKYSNHGSHDYWKSC
jgi:hypothetical protein